MTLRQTTRAIALLTGVASVGFLYVTSDLLLWGELSSLEEEAVRNRIEGSVHAYERRLDALDRFTLDWSAVREAIDGGGGAYKDQAPSLVVIFDGDGRVISTHPFGTDPEFQPAQLTRPLVEAGLIGRPLRGIVTLTSGPYLVASRPGVGPDRSTVLLANRLDETYVTSGTRDPESTTLLYGDAAEWPPEFFAGKPISSGTVVIPPEGEIISGYHALHDLFGRPAALLRVDLPRTLYLSGIQTRNFLLILFGTFVLASGALLLGAIRRSVLAPIDRLCDTLSHIAQNGHTDEGVQIGGSDEMARLGDQVNAMLARIRRSESNLIRTERMRVAGELSAGVSHNLNNILTGILGPAEYLENNLESPELLVEARRIHNAAAKARDLVSRFSQAVRHGTPLRSRAVEINTVVNQAIETARPRWQDEAQGQDIQIAIETDLQASIPIQGTPDELHDILVNLLLNAIDAIGSIEHGGTIRIVTSDDEGRVILSVSDNGVGMNTHTLNRVFEPFFTTKAEIGAGLGLATVHGTVSRWGGAISVNSQRGEGSEFVLEFPRSWEALPVAVDPKTPASIRSGRILIAEDDEIVREVLSESLSKIHDVVIVEDGQKALDLIQEDRFDVALIDLSLPRVPGDRIARRIRQVDPAVVTVLMTGWDLSENDPRRVPFDDFIPKPIASIHDVEDVVARSLLVHDARKLRG